MFDRIKRKFYSILKKDLKGKRGLVAIIFGIALVVMLGTTGTVVKHVKVTEFDKGLQFVIGTASRIALENYVKTGDKKKAEKAANEYITQQSVEMAEKNPGETWISSNAVLTIKEIKITPKGAAKARIHLLSEVPGRGLFSFQKTYYIENLFIS